MISYPDIVAHRRFLPLFLKVVGLALVATLQFQTLPMDIGIQMLPITTILVMAVFPFTLTRIQKSPMLTLVLIFSGYALLHSLIVLLIHLFSGEALFRFGMWIRQIAAFVFGICTFFVFRQSLQHTDTRTFAKTIAYSSIPAVLLGGLNLLWGGLGQTWAGAIVSGVRLLIAPYNYYSQYRATGLATEPAAFAVTIVVLLVPALMMLQRSDMNKWVRYAIYFLTTISFLWTFSSTGILVLLCLLGAGMFFGPGRKTYIITGLAFLAIVIGTLIVFPSNQVLRHAMAIGKGVENVSYDDRFYSAFGPFIRVWDSNTLFGYGLGGVTTHFSEVVPKKVEASMRAAKTRGKPSLVSVFGRTFAETGIIGFLMLMTIFGIGLWQLQILIRNASSPEETKSLRVTRLAYIAIIASIFISIGPYHSPLLWLWMAFVDARYCTHTAKLQESAS